MNSEIQANLNSEELIERSLAEEFKKQSYLLSQMLKNEGMKVEPFLPGLPYFTKLSTQKKQSVLRSLSVYVSICHEQVEEGYKIKDSNALTWRALSKLGLTPPSDLFNHLTNDEIIEIYDLEGHQLYRNFRFYEHCSYTLEELYSVEWWYLFSRDGAITDALMDEAQKVYRDEFSGVYFSHTDKHVVKELVSVDKLTNYYRAKVFSPLYAKKRVEGILVSIEAEIVPS